MRKKILAIVTSIMLSASLFITPFASYAAGLTQATNASKVTYGTLSADDIQLLRSVFDADYYAAKNPDLAGKSNAQLFDHFITKGIFEGRTCNAEFDPAAYASANKGLLEKYKKDIMAYYRDFYSKDKATRATLIATLEACANAKITVTGLADDSIVISPELYLFAKANKIEEYVIAKAAWQALQKGQPVEVTEDIIIIPDGALELAKGMTPVCTLSLNGQNFVWVAVRTCETGAALYRMDERNPLITVGNYEESEDNITIFASEFGVIENTAENQRNWNAEGLAEGGVVFAEETITSTGWRRPTEVHMSDSAKAYNIQFEDDYMPVDSWTVYCDPSGTENTTYTAVAGLEANDDGTYDVSIGLYNEENDFAVVEDYNCANEPIADLYQ